MTSPTTPECLLLSRLPVELRAQIYAHILSFPRPLKLRQIVAGSPNTSILRTCQQIHSEALPILYSTNTILATRNDFCSLTEPALQTPLRKDQLRHLLVKNCSQSIRCSSYSGGNNLFLEGCCDVCKPHARGFLAALGALPKLRSVLIDYHHHRREFEYIRESIRREESAQLICTDLARFQLISPTLPPGLDITFTDLPFHTIWTELSALHAHLRDIENPLRTLDATLRRLREEEHHQLPDLLYYLIDSRVLHSEDFVIEQIWREVDALTAAGASMDVRGEALERFTEAVGAWTRGDRKSVLRAGGH